MRGDILDRHLPFARRSAAFALCGSRSFAWRHLSLSTNAKNLFL
nr:hypothetical protein [Sphingomonas sp. CDS-1]